MLEEEFSILDGLFSTLSGVVFLGLFILFYFLPAWIAREKDHMNKKRIFWSNLFLGMTGGGWFVCLIWSLSPSE
ncbi:MAG: superinfection immunity protein [Alphaproteobacteria bacterium]|nr:superinfection immunity protein [Alphaproteobacteria bacterium]